MCLSWWSACCCRPAAYFKPVLSIIGVHVAWCPYVRVITDGRNINLQWYIFLLSFIFLGNNQFCWILHLCPLHNFLKEVSCSNFCIPLYRDTKFLATYCVFSYVLVHNLIDNGGGHSHSCSYWEGPGFKSRSRDQQSSVWYSWFFLVPPDKSQDCTLNRPLPTPTFHNGPSSSFINRFNIRRYRPYISSDSVVK